MESEIEFEKIEIGKTQMQGYEMLRTSKSNEKDFNLIDYGLFMHRLTENLIEELAKPDSPLYLKVCADWLEWRPDGKSFLDRELDRFQELVEDRIMNQTIKKLRRQIETLNKEIDETNKVRETLDVLIKETGDIVSEKKSKMKMQKGEWQLNQQAWRMQNKEPRSSWMA